jgi:hypothetical protein
MFDWITENWKLIVTLIIGVYEVLARIIPTVGEWSILAKIILFLKWISDSLNNRKKQK